ncbi:hypothetical protein ZIOFF_070572 [Zingiber officinale]|uniref:Neprosin PEP catalytic domain-containing protein n=1 Tax=Zingiber officinale TaxID=94328 RepID=A0A8J5C8R6_ZINOF|nr:hypothetical protein ZIOFF_070572 [Zingiber officinale]
MLLRILFLTIAGDLFDCVDMYKQPAFDHPLLKNHTLQLKPSSLPKGMKLAKSKPVSFYGFNDTCPLGTVLVQRAHKQDLNDSQLLRNQFRAQVIADDRSTEGGHYALLQTLRYQYYGAYAKMATYKLPDLHSGQSSSNAIILFGDAPTDGLNAIAVGWQVSTIIYDTSYPRFFTFWTDSKTGNWWVTYNDQLPLGYFPKELLPNLDPNANFVQMGGEVISSSKVPSPPMGSGHPSNEGRNKAAYFIQVQFVDQSNNLFVLDPSSFTPRADIKNYYSVADAHFEDHKDKYVFAYGGAGGFK